MIAKSETEVENLREAGKMMKQVVDAVLAAVKPGVPSMELERIAREATQAVGATPSYLGYSEKGTLPYPAALCVSVNNEIAHCPPKPEKILKAGDVVAIDFGLEYKGVYMDTAYTVGVGAIDKKAQNLIDGTHGALEAAINAAQAGGTTGDIGAAVQEVAKQYKLGVVKDLRGHGVGAAVHEDPLVPNFGKVGEGEKIKEGMVLALEPIFAEGSGAMVDDTDHVGYVTRDGSRAAHFEHTILITKDGAEILTA
ncbi:type I methionyl aminopeptidase [Candidatus Adlerbacteria bacterium RIFCSPHIGHO2_12_FULL_53_18]|uniref:Methionine aminopeptidase n=1 Tax=Candidatus Adlerbacteria bacterium RIFCSPHIGHO2_12_FULL_53_18 TaxID=1797242 RepID=A0A1F4XU50_9BACT|nr:MAG: type I methionyl aminopeptidase [Candidatus Adlerbacteria bacterium RIFCSPHIGHO2_12_FULL_53_18]